IAIASRNIGGQTTFQSAAQGTFLQMYSDHVRQGTEPLPGIIQQQSDREVWAVTFTAVFTDICPPDDSPCLPPRPGWTTVMVDYQTGDFIVAMGVAPNPGSSPSSSPSLASS